jgi:hypothetical protein
MKKIKYWGVVVVFSLLICVAFWWVISAMNDQKDPLNKSDAFVYSDEGILYWYEVTSRKGKVEGELHQQKIIEEIGKVPFMEENKYPITGVITEKGYEFKVKNSKKMMQFDASFSGKNLLVQKQRESDSKVFKPVDQEKLDEYVNMIQKELQMAIDQSEEKEKKRIKDFFSDLKGVYGYLYSTENGSFQLFLKIDEALREGELTGSLLMKENTGNEKHPYKETRYSLNGITDGHMVLFFTTVNGKQIKLKGNFHEDATSFDLSFWKTDKKLTFYAITEEEFNR